MTKMGLSSVIVRMGKTGRMSNKWCLTGVNKNLRV